MIKMVLNNNCVIKMQIIASERRRRPNTSLFALSLSLVALGGKKSERVAISKEDLLQNAFHSRSKRCIYRDAM